MAQVKDRNGKAQEVQLSLQDYETAYGQGKTLPQYLSTKFDTDVAEFGTPMEQIMASSGIYVRENKQLGLRPPTMSEMLSGGGAQIDMSTMTRNEGNARDGVLGRLLFPSIVLEMMNQFLLEDNSSYEGMFSRLVSTTTSVDGPRWTQPLIDVSNPRAERSNPVSQNSEPRAMVNISLAEMSYKIPTHSIGLSITDEAMRATTLDLVSIALREQAIGERGKIIDEAIKKMCLGDVDLGIIGLDTSLTSSSLDSEANAGSKFITQKSYLKFLRKDWKKLNIDWVITDIDTYLLLENRYGKPIWTGNEGTDGRLNSIVSAANPNIVDKVNFFIIDDVSLIGGAGRLVGLDSKRAIRKVVQANASYSAIENFVMRKSSAMRFDWSEAYFRMLPSNGDGWRVMTLA